SKKAKEHREMVAALAKGDEVVTSGGMLGKISKVGENFVELDVAEGITVKIQRQAVSNLMPKGTIKGL
ncbi:MAG: preprotein translocase subunit YajC, partial [Gammaproteobacteria bacterium]|nr:preprotein translocase subunit YajC [Gammaproteobacteria bacterium]